MNIRQVVKTLIVERRFETDDVRPALRGGHQELRVITHDETFRVEILSNGRGAFTALLSKLGRISVDEREVWLKGDPFTFAADSAESAEKQALDFLGAVEKKAA